MPRSGPVRQVIPVRLGDVGVSKLDADADAAATGFDRDVTRTDVIRAALGNFATLPAGTRKRLIRDAARAERGPKT